MFRTFSLSLAVAAALAALALTAHAEAPKKLSDYPAGTFIGDRTVMVVTRPDQFNSSPPFEVSNVLLLNRCSGGCMVTGGDINDARQHISTYIDPGPHILGEYKNRAGEIGTAADAEWAMLVQCVKEIYSPFNIVVTETKPTSGNYTEALVGGVSADVGLSSNIGGVAPAHDSCAPNDNAMSYTFANNSYYLQGTVQQRVWNVCSVVGQESAHHFGLDHAYEFYDMTSACSDPMTYRTDCGGQKFFRNKAAQCGEDAVRQCFCGGLQNSHAKILGVFGAGQSLIPPPTVNVDSPLSGGVAIDGQIVTWQAGSKRGIEKSELYLNNWKWAEVKGAAFGSDGQLNPSPYNTKFPAGVPNGVIDIQVKSYDDLGLMTASNVVTVTKGAPCANADACAKGQKCEAGKCFWDAPTGKLGDSCDYQQFCESNQCVITDEGGYCSQECIVGATDACPMGFECVQAGSAGACLPGGDGGGCCSAAGPDAVWFHGGLSLLVLGFVVRRRRRQRNRL
jgi:MYXO-CTERM domain-containing protein